MRKNTIRRLKPLARDLARLQNDVASIKRRLDRLIQRAQEAELLADATRSQLQHRQGTYS